MRRPAVIALGCIVLGAGALLPATAGAQANRVPVRSFQSSQFGTVLADANGQALYYWNKETRGRIRCTGSCAQAWPVVYVPKGVKVPQRIRGFKGVFGTVKRPDNGRLQLTWNNRPVYSYANERPREVLCNDVDKWFVVRV